MAKTLGKRIQHSVRFEDLSIDVRSFGDLSQLFQFVQLLMAASNQ